MTGAYLRTKTENGFDSIEVEHLTPEERRRHLKARDPEEIMRWMDLLCEKLVETEKMLIELETDGIIIRCTEKIDP